MTPHLRRDLSLAVAGTFLALGTPLGLYYKTTYQPTLTEAERSVVNYTPETFSFSRKSWQDTRLKAPVTPGIAAPSATPAQQLTQTALPPAMPVLPPALSFILQDGGSSKAIIGGSMVTVGGQVQGWTVERIERNRVLLRNRKGTTWLTLD